MATDLTNKSISFEFDSGATSLRQKYFGFKSPFVEILIDNKNINQYQCVVTKMEVELSNEYANSASFDLKGVFIINESKFKDDIVKMAMPGKKVEISVGYVDGSGQTGLKTNQETVFYGYIVTVNFMMDPKEGYSIRIECADVRCAMMSGRYYMGATEKTMLLAAKSILSKSTYKNLYKGLVMDEPAAAKEDDMEVQYTAESDYDFIKRAAVKNGFEFLMIQDKLVFRKNRGDSTTAILALGPGKGIYDMSLRRNIGGLVQEVEVINSDEEKGETIKSNVKTSAKWSADSSAKKIVGEAKKVVVDPFVKNKDEAKVRASAELDKIEWSYGMLNLRCIGLPELVPGRFVEIKNAATNVFDGKYYIQKVRHVLMAGKGFATTVEARTNQIGS